MKIGIIADPPLVIHSCAIVASSIAKNLIALGHEITYLGYGYMGDPIQHPDGYIIHPDIKPPTRFESVLNWLKETQPDIVYAHAPRDVHSEAIRACHGVGIKYVVHSFITTNNLSFGDLPQADLILACNQFTDKAMKKRGIEKVCYVPNGVDTELFKPILPEENPIVTDPKEQERFFKILFVGSNNKIKQPERTLLILKKFIETQESDEYLGLKLMLFMHTHPVSENADLISMIEGLGLTRNVIFTHEWQADASFAKVPYYYQSKSPRYTATPYHLMPYIYNLADVLLLPTNEEGMSTIFLEAQACGKPIIHLDDPVINEACLSEEFSAVKNSGSKMDISSAVDSLENCIELHQMPGFWSEYSADCRDFAKEFEWKEISKVIEVLLKKELEDG